MFKAERSSEVLRKNLRNRPYFNLKQCFAYMDTDGDGYLEMNDFREFLANNGFYATERELQCIISKCDQNDTGRITFGEFIDEFQPKI